MGKHNRASKPHKFPGNWSGWRSKGGGPTEWVAGSTEPLSYEEWLSQETPDPNRIPMSPNGRVTPENNEIELDARDSDPNNGLNRKGQ